MNTPINPQGFQQPSTIISYMTTNTNTFGFEVLNCGQAIFCVQTAEQFFDGPGNCDGGATTPSSCSSTTCNEYEVCSGSKPLLQDQVCVAACGTGYTEKPGKICQSKRYKIKNVLK